MTRNTKEPGGVEEDGQNESIQEMGQWWLRCSEAMVGILPMLLDEMES